LWNLSTWNGQPTILKTIIGGAEGVPAAVRADNIYDPWIPTAVDTAANGYTGLQHFYQEYLPNAFKAKVKFWDQDGGTPSVPIECGILVTNHYQSTDPTTPALPNILDMKERKDRNFHWAKMRSDIQTSTQKYGAGFNGGVCKVFGKLKDIIPPTDYDDRRHAIASELSRVTIYLVAKSDYLAAKVAGGHVASGTTLALCAEIDMTYYVQWAHRNQLNPALLTNE
jgi:hypothetical protein